MNKIFETGEFLEEWAVRIIVILLKGGEKNDLNNYCGITLSPYFPCLAPRGTYQFSKFLAGPLIEQEC